MYIIKQKSDDYGLLEVENKEKFEDALEYARNESMNNNFAVVVYRYDNAPSWLKDVEQPLVTFFNETIFFSHYVTYNPDSKWQVGHTPMNIEPQDKSPLLGEKD